MTERPKHPDVERFMVLYSKVRECTDDDPVNMAKMAHDDEKFQGLCLDLWDVEFRLSRAEKSSRSLFARTVGDDFIVQWRDCEERYSSALARVSAFALFDSSADDSKPTLAAEPPKLTLTAKRRAHFDFAAEEAKEEASAVERAIEWAETDITNMGEYHEDAEFCEGIERGVAEWRWLTRTAGFDLEGTFRRRKLIPFVLVPRSISDRYGDKDLISLFTHLQQAQEAFIYGTPFAALALMRSILELLLKRHYGAKSWNLEKCIDEAEAALPRGVNTVRLHRLRCLANEVLHPKGGSPLLPRDFESEIVDHLYVLRDLIEGASHHSTVYKGTAR